MDDPSPRPQATCPPADATVEPVRLPQIILTPAPEDRRLDHLLKDGWIAFLKGLDGQEVLLWHDVATDFHGMDDDRLKAGFWITEQPGCDRATASDFIRGLVGYGDLANALVRNDTGFVHAIAQLVGRYNAGAYPRFAISADNRDIEDADTIAGVFGTEEVHEKLAHMEAASGGIALPRPVGLLTARDRPLDKLPADAFCSAYGFDDQIGWGLYRRIDR